MISYFHKRKGILSPCEDSLTAVVFDTLKYLPIDIFWTILKKSLIHDKLPCCSCNLVQISFWDKWDSTNTSNSNFVEPDVFLQFDDFDVIIEAKRHNVGQQLETQMRNEIQAYFNENNEKNKQLYFIQLGGLNHRNDEADHVFGAKKVVICKTNWTNLLEQIVAKNNAIKESKSSKEAAYSRILEDAIKGFALHQYYKKRWLKDLTINSPFEIDTIGKLFPYAAKQK